MWTLHSLLQPDVAVEALRCGHCSVTMLFLISFAITLQSWSDVVADTTATTISQPQRLMRSAIWNYGFKLWSLQTFILPENVAEAVEITVVMLLQRPQNPLFYGRNEGNNYWNILLIFILSDWNFLHAPFICHSSPQSSWNDGPKQAHIWYSAC